MKRNLLAAFLAAASLAAPASAADPWQSRLNPTFALKCSITPDAIVFINRSRRTIPQGTQIVVKLTVGREYPRIVTTMRTVPAGDVPAGTLFKISPGGGRDARSCTASVKLRPDYVRR